MGKTGLSVKGVIGYFVPFVNRENGEKRRMGEILWIIRLGSARVGRLGMTMYMGRGVHGGGGRERGRGGIGRGYVHGGEKEGIGVLGPIPLLELVGVGVR